MTVLAKYQRLEAEGIWRPNQKSQRIDVIVSIGKATITISTANGLALAHWSLPAIQRLNPDETPALYRPGEDSEEVLELLDDEMVTAVEKVLRAIERGQKHPGRLRALITIGIAMLVIGVAIWWLPNAIIRHTASLVPEAARSSIGATLLREMDRVTGAPCDAPAGERALRRLEERLFPDQATKLVVLPSALTETGHLPGGAIMISHKLVEDYETPEVLAGFLLEEDVRRKQKDPLARLLNGAGLRAALTLLSQGRLPEDTLKRMAEWVVARVPEKVPDDALIARMKVANVPSKPYAFARDIAGEGTRDLIEASVESEAPILEDGDWIALQRICED